MKGAQSNKNKGRQGGEGHASPSNMRTLYNHRFQPKSQISTTGSQERDSRQKDEELADRKAMHAQLKAR